MVASSQAEVAKALEAMDPTLSFKWVRCLASRSSGGNFEVWLLHVSWS